MRIKRLDITGFKSFMDRSVFSFDAGITGVVGPNGCGKSNVVDAIRWAMGEQSAKNLRGRGMEDVIFNGSESKPPLSMAEVSLTFSVEDGDVLPEPFAGFPEITVTRRLFRNGDSEYLINKTTCRLLDITELFLGTGVGTKAYSIIEQGRVGLIVSSKPEDRRSLVEEAAGVTKYKSRRKAAERKMEYTQQNLLRVTDLVSELEKRLESLSRQAKKAEKYKKLKGEIRELELVVAAHRQERLAQEREQLKVKLEELAAREEALGVQVGALESGIAGRRAQLETAAQELESAQQRLFGLEAELQRHEQNLSYWKTDQAQTQAQRISLEQERALLETQRAETAEAVASLEAALAAIQQAAQGDEEALRTAQAAFEQLLLDQEALSRTVEGDRQRVLELAQAQANHESQLANLAGQCSELDARSRKVQEELGALSEEERKLDRGRSEVARHVNQSRQLTLELAERKGLEEEALVQVRQAFSENEVALIALREELGEKKSRLSSLEEIQRGYEGFDRGVRSVMLAAGERPAERGIFGLVADVVATDPKFEKAIEAALGERLQHVLVADQDRALELVGMLKERAEGRSTFVPVSSLGQAPATGAALDRSFPGVLAAGWEQVRGDQEPVAQVARQLLAGVVIMEDLASARAYARAAGPVFTLVTLDGDVLRADGSITGGVMEGPAVGALQKKREIHELVAEVASLTERYQERLAQHQLLQKQMAQAEELLKGLSKNQHSEELNLASQEKDLHRAVADLARVREQVHALAVEQNQLTERTAAVEAQRLESQDKLAHAQAERATREEQIREQGAQLEQLRQTLEARSGELTALKIKVASQIERIEGARRELAQRQQQQRELLERAEKADAALLAADQKLGELQGRMAEADVAVQGLRGEREGLAQEVESRKQAQAELAAKAREEEASLKELRGQLQLSGEALAEVALRERELGLELTHLLEQLRERHQVESLELLAPYRERPLDAQTDDQLRELKGQLDRMGEINLTAIEEHAELSTRYEFLKQQEQDLSASLAQLQEAIVKIDQTSRERFTQTFQVIDQKFQAVYPRLFGGGRAALVLTEDPGGEPGVEILAQPPGKKLQSVTLMSGGEKALTAVALLFAIFLIKPTPFCLLDEVDAPLDEGNVGRYNDMVKEMSKQSQFILITHNKRTMEIADTLYGVTMEEPGISKLVAVKLKEMAAQNDDQKVA